MKERFPRPKKLFLREKKYKGESMQQPHLPELKQFLEDNWEQINEIYVSLQKRAGVEKPVHIPHRIKTNMDLEAPAATSPYDRTTVIFKRKNFATENPDLSKLVHYWVHEAVHSTSHTKIRNSVFPKISHIGETGVAIQSFTINHGPEDKGFLFKQLGMDLNEAITEHIANTILAELSRRGIFKRDDKKIREEAVYKSQGESFAKIVQAFAKYLEVDEELVWKSFVRQYFTNELPTEEFHSTLMQLAKEKELEPVREELNSLIDRAKKSRIIQVGQEFEISDTERDEKEQKAHEWARRGLRLDQ